MGNCLKTNILDKCELQIQHYTIYQRGRKIQVPSLQPLSANALYRMRQKNPKSAIFDMRRLKTNTSAEDNGPITRSLNASNL
jgi:hypothetical protein